MYERYFVIEIVDHFYHRWSTNQHTRHAVELAMWFQLCWSLEVHVKLTNTTPHHSTPHHSTPQHSTLQCNKTKTKPCTLSSLRNSSVNLPWDKCHRTCFTIPQRWPREWGAQSYIWTNVGCVYYPACQSYAIMRDFACQNINWNSFSLNFDS